MKKIIVCGEHLPTEWPMPAHGVSAVLRSYQYEFLLDAGLFPVVLPPYLFSEAIYEDLLQESVWVVLFWWRDIDPSYYNEDVMCQMSRYDIRDEIELSMIRCARKLQKPIFWICRWLQVINVALGWSLYQNIQDQYTDQKPLIHMQNIQYDMKKLSHDITIQQTSLLHSLIWISKLRVNTFHHQTIKELWNWLVASACTSDGIIESIESKDQRIFAVQRHPEISYGFDDTSKLLLENICKKFFNS